MELHVIRHGLTEENLAGRYQGRGHGVLTQEQTEALRRSSVELTGFDAVYSSPLGRCIDTARLLGVETFTIDERLRERDFGVFEGLSAEECALQYPGEFSSFLRFDADYRVSGGESRSDHLARTMAWLADAERHRKVLAFVHGGTIDFLYRMGRRLPLHGGSTIYSASNVSRCQFAVELPDVHVIEYDAAWPWTL